MLLPFHLQEKARNKVIHMGKTKEGTLKLLELDLRRFTKLSLAVDSRSVPEVPWDGNLWEWRESSCQTG